jgi:hypothetical protein
MCSSAFAKRLSHWLEGYDCCRRLALGIWEIALAHGCRHPNLGYGVAWPSAPHMSLDVNGSGLLLVAVKTCRCRRESAVATVILPAAATVEKSLWELLKVQSMTATAGKIWEHKAETDFNYPIPGPLLQNSLGSGLGY